jgi:hypothetical protein
LTLPTDGSLDSQGLSKNLRALLLKYDESLVLSATNVSELFRHPKAARPFFIEGFFERLLQAGEKLPQTEFQRDPEILKSRPKPER